MRSLLLAVTLAVAAPCGAAPRLDPPAVDFQKVPVGQVARRCVTITNPGPEKLTVTMLIASCGCTTATIDQDVIAPGKTAQLQVSLDAARPMAYDQHIQVYWRESADPTVVPVMGTGLPAIAYAPDRVDSEHVTTAPAESQRVPVRVSFLEGKKPQSLSLVSYNPVLTATLEMRGDHAMLYVGAVPGATVGRHSGYLELGEGPAAHPLPVQIHVVPPVPVKPEIVTWGFLRTGQQRSCRVEFGEPCLEIESAQIGAVDGMTLTSRTEKGADGRCALIVSALGARPQSFTTYAEVRVQTREKRSLTFRMLLRGGVM